MRVKTDGNEIEKETAVKTRNKVEVRKEFCSSRIEQRKRGKRSIRVNEYTKIASEQTNKREEREEIERTPSSDSTHEDSEDKESDSDDSSEGEEDRDSEQKSSNEEKETEPDDESSPDTSEEEVKKKPSLPYMKEIMKAAGGRKEKRMKIATDDQDLSRSEDQSGGRSRDQEGHDIQPKKRIRRHWESSMSPKAKSSSSPSTSQVLEVSGILPGSKERIKQNENDKNQRKKKENVKSLKVEKALQVPQKLIFLLQNIIWNITETESKKLKKVFKRFFGRLCFVIKNPVELATLL